MEVRRNHERRMNAYIRAAKAIEPLLELDTLVEKQVRALMQKLSASVLSWKERIYSASYDDAPVVAETDVTPNGTLVIRAEFCGTSLDAHHIANASDLRATLLAIVLAFWENLASGRGVIATMLFDDPHELFDVINRRRLARTLSEFASRGGQPVVTTNDSDFAREIVLSGNFEKPPVGCDRRRVHPVTAGRPHMELGFFKERIEEKRSFFEADENRNKEEPARDYVSYLRVFIENRLADFFGLSEARLPGQPTLSDLLDAIRSKMKVPIGVFSTTAFSNLVNDGSLRTGSEFIRLMNMCHHGKRDEITFKEVNNVREDCRRVMNLVMDAHEEYERWLRRDDIETPAKAPSAPRLSPSRYLRSLLSCIWQHLHAGVAHQELHFQKKNIPVRGSRTMRSILLTRII